MNVILVLLGASLFLGGGGLVVFLWALRKGQYEDMEGAAQRILFDTPPSAPSRPAISPAISKDRSAGR